MARQPWMVMRRRLETSGSNLQGSSEVEVNIPSRLAYIFYSYMCALKKPKLNILTKQDKDKVVLEKIAIFSSSYWLNFAKFWMFIWKGLWSNRHNEWLIRWNCTLQPLLLAVVFRRKLFVAPNSLVWLNLDNFRAWWSEEFSPKTSSSTAAAIRNGPSHQRVTSGRKFGTITR